jgi:FkbM family methyltransferase
MKRDYRLVNVRNTPMLIFDEGEMISDDIIRYNDFYEYWVFKDWVNYFPSEGLLLDIGANIGNHSLQFNHFKPNLEIWSFELLFENYKLLKLNTKNYPNIKTFNVGVGSNTSMVTFSNDHEGNSGVAKIVYDGINHNLVIKLDDIDFYDKKITLIKLDVEGHEYSVIEGSINTLKTHKPMIWIEDFDGGAVGLLESIGYKLLEEAKHSNFLMIYE